MLRVMPINNCEECPRLIKEEEFHCCTLSDTMAYDLESDWIDYLEQFCPLIYLETIINDSYEMGKQYSDDRRNIIRTVRESTSTDDRWVRGHKFLEEIGEQ